MATDQELPDERDDAEMTSLLKTVSAAPELRGDFARALSERLDRAYQSRFPAGTEATGAMRLAGLAMLQMRMRDSELTTSVIAKSTRPISINAFR